MSTSSAFASSATGESADALSRYSRGSHAEEDRALLIRHQRDGSCGAREQLIRRNMPLARALARRYYHGREPFDDLVQVAYMGLVKAADRFEVERGTSFSSFAVPTILGELRRHFRDSGWAMRVPRQLQELVLKTRKAADQLLAKTGHAPTPAEIGAAIGVSTEEVLEALSLAQADYIVSLDHVARGLDEEGGPLAEMIGGEDGGYELVEDREAAAAAIRTLPRRERAILGMRFMQDMKQSEIAAELGCSQMQVSRVLRRATAAVAKAAGAE